MFTVSPSATEYERGRVHTALVHIHAVKEKIESGEYKREYHPCYCGSTEEIEMLTHDRYDLPHRMVICKECALIRANPRMDKAAYTDFYNNHYRSINSPFYMMGIKSRLEEINKLWASQVQKGRYILEGYNEQGREHPKTVLDVGCHLGGMLVPFQEVGARCYGVEIDEAVITTLDFRGITAFRTLQEVADSGVKFDFVMMQDMIEHYTDLHEVGIAKELLKPDGLLYVFTPGVFRNHPRNYFQIAHTYQFCAATLEYVLETQGFHGRFLEEGCVSFWNTEMVEGYEIRKPFEWVEYELDHLYEKNDRKLPPLRATCKFTREERYEHIRENCKKGIPDLHEIRNTYEGKIVIVSGGPSVDTEIETIRAMKENHIPIMVIARMYPWAVKNGIYPDFVVTMDSMQEQEKGFTDLWQDTVHLIGSVTRSTIVDMLEGHTMYLWDAMDDEAVRKIRQEGGYEVCTVVNGGGTVAVSCMSLAMILGFRDIHMFGLDCLIPQDAPSHAAGISGDSMKQQSFPVTIEGEKLYTTMAMLEFARATLDMVWAGKVEGLLDKVKFHGNSLINRMWDGRFLSDKELEGLELKSGTRMSVEDEHKLKEKQ